MKIKTLSLVISTIYAVRLSHIGCDGDSIQHYGHDACFDKWFLMGDNKGLIEYLSFRLPNRTGQF